MKKINILKLRKIIFIFGLFSLKTITLHGQPPPPGYTKLEFDKDRTTNIYLEPKINTETPLNEKTSNESNPLNPVVAAYLSVKETLEKSDSKIAARKTK